MAEKDIKKCELVLEKVLKSYHSSMYSLGAYQDDAFCLQNNGKNWEVYNGIHGNKMDLKIYTNIIEACLDIIRRLALTDDERLLNENAFFNGIFFLAA